MNNFCECDKDGYCTRYQREMVGRFREICAGINCDLGTSAAFRDQWVREAGMNFQKFDVHGKPITKKSPIPLLLKTDQAPGDAVAMTAAIYSLHKAHPGKYLTHVMSDYPEVFQYNPDVANNGWGESILKAQPIQMHYPAIHDSNKRGIHFMQGWCEFLGYALGINIPLLTNRPHLYFPQGDVSQGNYWIVCSGGKSDFTNKLWGNENYQEVVNRSGVGFIQVGDKIEDHPRLQGCADIVGRTTLRQLFDLVRGARGVLCGVSLLMHVAAALDKPCVVIAGGREPVQWNAYPKQHYLHAVGVLPCTSATGEYGACWRSRIVPQGDNAELDKDPCLRPVDTVLRYKEARVPLYIRPECMTLISPEHVVQLIRMIDSYL